MRNIVRLITRSIKEGCNFDMLRQMLSGDVLEGDEAYEFSWVGKKGCYHGD